MQIEEIGEGERRFDHEDKGLIKLSQNDEWIESYATDFERITGLRKWNKGKAKCGATGRALMYYFYKRHPHLADLKEAVQNSSNGVEALKQEIERNRISKTGTVYMCESVRLDHVFVIQQTGQDSYRILQSFVNQYTLQANLAVQKTLNYKEIMQFVSDLQKLVDENQWTEQIAQQYQKLFLSKPGKPIVEEFATTKHDFSYISLPYDDNHPGEEIATRL